MARPIGSTTRRNQIILVVAFVMFLLCCVGGVAFVATGGQPQPGGGQVCVGGQWDGEECEFPEEDDD